MKAERRAMIEVCNGIIDEYQAMGFKMTLRQLYYQCVSRDIIPNSERSYKNMGSLLSTGRLMGLVDWLAIEDRVRRPVVPHEWTSIKAIAEAAAAQFRLDRWAGQTYYPELWVEKDALANVLAPIADEYHITLMVNRGYSSQSAMWEAANRFKEGTKGGAWPVLLYLGDHDPSGEDMVRDVYDRLKLFGVKSLDMRKVALTMDQIEEHNPPPNPAKMTDSRAAKYVEQHGEYSWEVDALPPDVLRDEIETHLDELVDRKLMDAIIAEEERQKQLLLIAADGIDTDLL